MGSRLSFLQWWWGPNQRIWFCDCFWPCCMAHRILIPWSRTEPAPLTVKVLSPTPGPPGNSHGYCFETRFTLKLLQLVCVFVCVSVAQLSLTLCDPMDCRQPGPSVHGILQARIWEWIAISFSRGSFQSRDWTCVFRIGRWILYHGTTWKAQQRNSQAVGEHLFIINTWKLGEVSVVLMATVNFPQNIFLSSLCYCSSYQQDCCCCCC